MMLTPKGSLIWRVNSHLGQNTWKPDGMSIPLGRVSSSTGGDVFLKEGLSDQLSFLHGKMRGGTVASRPWEGFRLHRNYSGRLDRGDPKHRRAPERLETQVGSSKQERLDRCWNSNSKQELLERYWKTRDIIWADSGTLMLHSKRYALKWTDYGNWVT